jgi:hypothetical protein
MRMELEQQGKGAYAARRLEGSKLTTNRALGGLSLVLAARQR